MRKRLTLLTAVVVASLIAAVAAWAGNPHFLRFSDPELVYSGASATAAKVAAASASDTSDPRVLIADIVVVGVKEGVTTSLTAPFEAVYVCVNSGGNVPSAANKTVPRRSADDERRLPGGPERPRDGLVADRAAAEPGRGGGGDRVQLPVGAGARVRPGRSSPASCSPSTAVRARRSTPRWSRPRCTA